MKFVLILLLALPVIAAQYFNLERSLLGLLTALLSLGLLVVVLLAAPARFRAGPARKAIALSFITLLAAYLFGQFVSYYIQGSYFNRQFYFHMNWRSLTETRAVYWPLSILFLTWLASLWACILILQKERREHGSSLSFLALLLVLALALDPGLRQSVVSWVDATQRPSVDSLDDVDWERLKLDPGVLEERPLEALAGRNLVLVFMEGFENVYIDNDVFPGLTPNLHRFEDTGWRLDNLISVEGTEWTMGGIVASLCGTPLLHDLGLGGNVVLFSDYLDRAVCLPDLLETAGYEQVFMGGASLNFAGKGRFFSTHGYDRVLGRNELVARLDDPSYGGGWGLFDDSLFELAAAEFDALAASDQPFNLTLLTLDTHAPSGEPSASCSDYPMMDNPMLDAVHCTDQLLGQFLDRLQQHPAFEDTVVVLVSDHLGMRNAAFPLFPEGYPRRLYFHALNAEPIDLDEGPATPMDVAPTVLDLLGVEHNASFLAGRNLRTSGPLDTSDLDMFTERQQAISFINMTQLSSRREGTRRIYTLDEDSVDALDFSADVSDVRFSDSGLAFSSRGNDPYIVLPELVIESPAETRLHVTLESDHHSVFKVYFQTPESPRYSESHTLYTEVNKGRTRIVFSLDSIARTSRLRLDPATMPGDYLIRSIEVRSF